MLSDSYTEPIYEEMILREMELQYYNNSEKYYKNAEWFMDYGILDDTIDWYCEKTHYDAKQVVNKYGVLEAIEEYENALCDFELSKNKDENYFKLYRFLVGEYIQNEYYETFEKMSEENEEEENEEESEENK